MFQRLSIVLASVSVGDILKELLHKICQIVHTLYKAKDIKKRINSSIFNLI